MADTNAVRTAVSGICEALASDEEHFRALDADLGDGDLGVTVRMGTEAVNSAISDHTFESVGEVLAVVGREFSRANPSTLAGLIGAALKAVSRQVGDATELRPADWIPLLERAADTIAQRGGARAGDKTILDGLLGSLAAMREAPAGTATALDLAQRARAGAERASEAVKDLESRVGRASWQGARTVGFPDPGVEVWLVTTGAIERFVGATDSAQP